MARRCFGFLLRQKTFVSPIPFEDSQHGHSAGPSGQHRSFAEAYVLSDEVFGSGAFSTVRKATQRATGEIAACKIAVGPEAQAMAQREAQVMNRLDHESILCCREHFVSADCVMLVTDLMSGGELLGALEERGSYAEEDARVVVSKLLSALVHMHSKGVVHRDLKLENILIASRTDHTNIKIADFGLAAEVSPSRPKLSKACGSPQYVAPEMLTSTSALYDSKVDVWSVGVILHYLLSGYPPFDGETLADILLSIRRGAVVLDDPVWDLISSGAKSLVRLLLTRDPGRRPRAEEALEHPWLRES